MTASSQQIALRARYVVPVSTPPIADGVVVVDGERIARVGKREDARDAQVTDLGNVALLPGLVNAHTHLEFSGARSPLGRPGMAFPAWLRAVIASRSGRSNDARAAVAAGLLESIHCGTTTLGEIATSVPLDELTEAPRLGGVAYWELMGTTRDAAREQIARLAGSHAFQWPAAAPSPQAPLPQGERGDAPILAPIPNPKSEIRNGLSPHAPYTASLEFVSAVVEASAQYGAPVAMHLAESVEELEFLRARAGPFRDLLEERGRWNPSAYEIPLRPLDYLRALALAPRSLIVHGNYLDDGEIDFIAAHADRMGVVYCPRTHAYFGHARHPLARLLSAGANVCLGTDSRASNPDLSMLAELRFVARQFPELDRATVLELATARGARALGLDAEIGTVEPGKLASLVAIALPDRDDDPLTLLLDSDEPVTRVWLRGVEVASVGE